MEIVLDVLDGTLGDVGQGEARFSLFVDSVRAHLLEHIGVVGQVEACFIQFGESVRLDAR